MLTIVIPVYNEADSLRPLFEEIDEVAANNYELEIIFIDDGSNDGSWKVIEELAEKDARVIGIRFRRNFGKAAALTAGFRAASGEQVMTLDADLQDDPHEIPKFLAKLEEGYDVVSGYKQKRHDPWHKVYPSRVFNWMVSTLSGVKLHDHNCGIKCYRREVLDEIRIYGELHRFIPVLAGSRGFRIGELVVNHRARQFGHSKYGVWRFVKGFLDLLTVTFLTGFGHRPQHLLGTVGLFSFFLGGLGLLYLASLWTISRLVTAWEPIHLHERFPMVIYSVALLLLGAQMLTMGLLAELITSYHGRDEDTYSIVARTNPPAQKPSRHDAPT